MRPVVWLLLDLVTTGSGLLLDLFNTRSGLILAPCCKNRHYLAMLSSDPIRGYIEGYYGRLLSWQDRHKVATHLAQLNMNAYLYAPKEDPAHRLDWRRAWDDQWVRAFRAFCDHAHAHNIAVYAGIAPGLDFDFAAPETDFAHLHRKADQLHACGADAITLMFDDIEPPMDQFPIDGKSEAHCQAAIANRLAQDYPLQLVPRIYADEIATPAETTSHYRDLADTLAAKITLFHCGARIVGTNYDAPETRGVIDDYWTGPRIWWDNIYCNDYCPRRLFVGPHGGGAGDLMLNGTGHLATDLLILSLGAAPAVHDRTSPAYRDLLRAAGIPEAFDVIQHYFDRPVLTGASPAPMPPPSDTEMAAIETLLWRWKTPLAREWYPYLFGLKHDALMQRGELPDDRIAKTQLPPFYAHVRPRR